ncbi:hypothetical protein FRB94_001429 [Tulasnella sp. JGI-2019a]|nr:hypothetical protein FRB94_001429 [Tulasnella sp. JGI-2019a]
MTVAIKEMTKETDPRMLLKEIKVWCRLQHPHVLPFLGASITASPPFIVSQYMPNGDIKKYLSKRPNINRVQLIHEIALGMLYIHGKNIVHGDLKCVNVLIDDALKARITDFGLSEIKSHATSSLAMESAEGLHVGGGTLRYMSPEALHGVIDKASDVYAFAMTVYEIFANVPPFLLVSDAAIFHLISEKHTRLTRPTDPPTINRGLTDAMWSLVWSTSEPLAADRPNFGDICKTTEYLADDRCRELKQGNVAGQEDNSDDIFDLLDMDMESSSIGAPEMEEGNTKEWGRGEATLRQNQIQNYATEVREGGAGSGWSRAPSLTKRLSLAEITAGDAPMILPIPLNDPRFNEIVNRFKISWRHPRKPIPTVRLLYKIVQTEKLMEDYNDYRQKVESEGNFTSRRAAMPAGNECRRWHGTRRVCNIGDDAKNLKLCEVKNCTLCSIIRKSFQITLTGAPPGWSSNQFGQCIYTSATSSKSDDYSFNLSRSPYKAMMLTTVVVGSVYKMPQDSTKLQGPPQGYHSVVCNKGGTLNYDELFVYHNDAIRPAWLVIYS